MYSSVELSILISWWNISRTFLSWKTQMLYPLNNSSLPPSSTFWLSSLDGFLFFFCLHVLARTFNTMLKRSGKSRPPSLVFYLRGKDLSLLPMSMLVIGFWHTGVPHFIALWCSSDISFFTKWRCVAILHWTNLSAPLFQQHLFTLYFCITFW